MQALDYLKAFGVSLLLLVSNVLIAFGVMAVYGHLIDPGHDQAYYEAAALRIAPWSSVVAGAALFLPPPGRLAFDAPRAMRLYSRLHSPCFTRRLILRSFLRQALGVSSSRCLRFRSGVSSLRLFSARGWPYL